MIEAVVLVEAAASGCGRSSRPSPRCRTMSSSRSLRLTVTTAIRSPEGDGAIDSASVKWVFSWFGARFAAVVGRPLLVAERLEALLQVALERLIELVRRHPERFFVGVLAAADDALAQREQELADAFLAEPRLDELEDRVAEVVDRGAGCCCRRSPRARVIFGTMSATAASRTVIRSSGVHCAALVVGQPFVHPQRHAPADQPLRDDVELELVRELVDDQAVQPVRRIVDRQQHAVAVRLGERRRRLPAPRPG